eukprot:11223649-Lingulodinium_polyedra.AAC.1
MRAQTNPGPRQDCARTRARSRRLLSAPVLGRRQRGNLRSNNQGTRHPYCAVNVKPTRPGRTS